MSSSIIATGTFWTAFGLACAWLLPRYYRARAPGRVKELRYAAIAMDTFILLSLTLPWIPASRGGPLTGVAVLLGGDALFATFVLGVCAACAFLVAGDNPVFVKISACSQLFATVLLFTAMLRLLPGTFTLEIGESAPIAAALLLLASNVAAVLLWHQSQVRIR